MAFEENSQASSMTLGRKAVYSFAGGLLITLVTALYPNTALIGASAHGYPFPWLAQSLYPPGGPMILLWTGLVLDILVWMVAAFLVISLYHIFR